METEDLTQLKERLIKSLRRKILFEKIYTLFGIVLGFAGFIGLWHYYGWRAVLFVFLILWSNNINNRR